MEQKEPSISFPKFSVAEEPVTVYSAPSHFEPSKEPELFSWRPKVITRVGKYILVEDPEGIRLIDGKAARFRVAYEQLAAREEKKAVQHLLIPIQIEVTPAEKALLLDSLAVFEDVGISIRPFGETTFIVDAVPSLLEGDEVITFVHAFLEQGTLSRERKIAGALKRALHIGHEGAEALIERLFKCQESDIAPDGKKIHKLLTEKELEKVIS